MATKPSPKSRNARAARRYPTGLADVEASMPPSARLGRGFVAELGRGPRVLPAGSLPPSPQVNLSAPVRAPQITQTAARRAASEVARSGRLFPLPSHIGRRRFRSQRRKGRIERHHGLFLAAHAPDRDGAIRRFLLADDEQDR